MEKGASGWFRGMNSTRDPWILDDAMYAFGLNVVNRGGIVQTRPGYRIRLTLPSGILQGMEVFYANKDDDTTGYWCVFAVSGNVYATKFTDDGRLTQATNWDLHRLKNINFNALAPIVQFCISQQAITQTNSATGPSLSLVNAHNVLIMQDGGISSAAYFDGTLNDQMDETAPKFGVPRGSWMAYSGNRLWVARDSALLSSDLNNPLSFAERVNGTARGDFRLPDAITGMINTIGQDRQANLVVFTEKSSFNFLSYIQDRTTWTSTPGFQTTIYPTLGCVSGLSPVNHAGLLWWYSHGGLVSSDSATTAFLTSRIKYRDVEMSRSKRSLSADLSGLCTCSFESYLMVSAPVDDFYNSQTFVMDYAIADELLGQEQPAWQGVWAGTRPVKWVSADVNGDRRCFFASVDYQKLPNSDSANHIWEAFQDDRRDTIEYTQPNGLVNLIHNPIYCEFDGKAHGDGLDQKIFRYAVINMVECGGAVNIRASYRGTRGGYKEVMRKKILAPLDSTDFQTATLQELIASGATLVPQARKLVTQEAPESNDNPVVESDVDETRDRAFSLLIQWCGRAGIQSYQIFMDPDPESAGGKVEEDETKAYAVTQDGTAILINP